MWVCTAHGLKCAGNTAHCTHSAAAHAVCRVHSRCVLLLLLLPAAASPGDWVQVDVHYYHPLHFDAATGDYVLQLPTNLPQVGIESRVGLAITGMVTGLNCSCSPGQAL